MLMYPSVGNGFQGELMMLLQDAWLVVGMQLGAVGVLALWALPVLLMQKEIERIEKLSPIYEVRNYGF